MIPARAKNANPRRIPSPMTTSQEKLAAAAPAAAADAPVSCAASRMTVQAVDSTHQVTVSTSGAGANRPRAAAGEP